MTTVVTVIDGQATALRLIAVTTAVVTAAAVLAAPIRADMINNAFLSALTNAGVAYTQPTTTTAAGQSVCPMLVQPGGSFDAIVADMAAGNGMSEKSAGIFTIVAIATYCPAVLAPLLNDRAQS